MTPEDRERMWRDPASWRWGVFYDNPRDPRVVVPKRSWRWGGWAFNVAHPLKAGGTFLMFVALVLGPFFLVRALGYGSTIGSVLTLGASIASVAAIANQMAKG